MNTYAWISLVVVLLGAFYLAVRLVKRLGRVGFWGTVILGILSIPVIFWLSRLLTVGWIFSTIFQKIQNFAGLDDLLTGAISIWLTVAAVLLLPMVISLVFFRRTIKKALIICASLSVALVGMYLLSQPRNGELFRFGQPMYRYFRADDGRIELFPLVQKYHRRYGVALPLITGSVVKELDKQEARDKEERKAKELEQQRQKSGLEQKTKELQQQRSELEHKTKELAEQVNIASKPIPLVKAYESTAPTPVRNIAAASPNPPNQQLTAADIKAKVTQTVIKEPQSTKPLPSSASPSVSYQEVELPLPPEFVKLKELPPTPAPWRPKKVEATIDWSKKSWVWKYSPLRLIDVLRSR